jgi:hypothetical protein
MASPRMRALSLGITTISIVAFTAFIPALVHADTTSATTAGFQIFPAACNCPGLAPAWGCVLQTFQNILTFIVAFATLIITIFLAWAGFTYMTSGDSGEKRKLANQRILNAAIGLAIVLCSYLLVDSILQVIYNPSNPQFGPWNSILAQGATTATMCLQVHNPPNALPTIGAANSTGASASTGTQSNVAGSCQVPSTGPCDSANLSQSCFGGNSSNAAQICNKESGANPNSVSRSDVIAGTNSSYSIGLFQINITNSFKQPVDGQNCSAAFAGGTTGNGACQGANVVQHGSGVGSCNVRIVNQQLYNDCVTAAEVPTNNINAACSLNNNGNSGWGRWATHTACGL